MPAVRTIVAALLITAASAQAQTVTTGTSYVFDANDAPIGPVLNYDPVGNLYDGPKTAIYVDDAPVVLLFFSANCAGNGGLAVDLYYESNDCTGTPYLFGSNLAGRLSLANFPVCDPDLTVYVATSTVLENHTLNSRRLNANTCDSDPIGMQSVVPAVAVATGFVPPFHMGLLAAPQEASSVPAVAPGGLLALLLGLAGAGVWILRRLR